MPVWVPAAPAIIIPAPQELLKQAMMPGIIVPAGLFGAVSTPAVDPVTYLGQIGGGSTGSSGTVDLGAADANCLVIVCVAQTRTAATGRQVNSVTMDGTTGTIHAQVGNNASSGAGAAIASRTVTVGGVITISWVLSGAVGDQRAYIYKAITTHPTPGTGVTANGNDPSVSPTLSAGGFCIAIMDGAGGTSSGHNVTWTGVTKDDQEEGGGNIGSSAHSYNNAAGVATVSVASIATNEVLVAVPWPAP
jgi:hypothetical protein